MSWLLSAARRIGSSDAVSWPVFWVTLAAASIGSFVTNAEAPWAVRVLALVLGQCALWLPLYVIGIILRRDRERPRPILVLTTAVAGLMVRAVVIGAIFAAYMGADEVKWSNRFIGALFNVGLAFVISAYVVSSMRERRRQIAQLQAVQRELAESVVHVSEEFSHRNEEAVARVQSILLAELSALDPADADGSLVVLQRTAIDVVRPLSHELAKARPDEGRRMAAPVNAAVSWRNVLDGAATGSPFLPGFTVLLMSFELLAATVAYPPGAFIFAGMAVVMLVLLLTANAVLRRVLLGRRQLVRMATVVVAALIIGAVMAFLTRIALISAPMVNGLVVGAFVFSVIFTLGVGIGSSLGRDRERIVAELAASSHMLQRRLVQWRQVQWFQQKALSRALHGPLQTAVTAGALRLDAAIRAGEVSPAVVDQVRGQLLETLGGLGTFDASITSVSQAMDLITSTWEGLCAVSTSLGSAVDEVLDHNIALRSCAVDIVTEATSNAVRHGGATRVDVDIHLSDDAERELRILISSDSCRVDEGPVQRGLGTALLDDCTLQWCLEDCDQGMTLVASLPVDA